MIRGLYASASAMVADLLRQDVVANNIANATTPGFNRDCAGFESFPSMLIQASDLGPVLGSITQGSRTGGTYVDTQKGTACRTGSAQDVFIRGDGYFVVQDGDRVAYTRHGSFVTGNGGLLATQQGHAVLGVAGPLRANSGTISIDARGWVRSGDTTVGRLKVVRFGEQVQLVKNEHGYLVPGGARARGLGSSSQETGEDAWRLPGASTGPDQVAEPDLEPGAVEMSNVNPVTEMVSLINVLRSYEANAKALQAQDETLARAVNDIAR